MRLVPAVALALAACGRGSPEAQFAPGPPTRQSLVGAWDVKLSLTHAYQLELREPSATAICGSIGFVDNNYAKGGSAPTSESRLIGVYDLDLEQIGLDWRGDTPFPAATASEVGGRPGPSASIVDSVAILLNPGSEERIVLNGRYDADRIKGRWTAQSSRGTAVGSFTLVPHSNSRGRDLTPSPSSRVRSSC